MPRGLGLAAPDVVAVVSLVDGYVRGAAQALCEAEQATAGTGVTDDEWWEARSRILDGIDALVRR